MDPYSSSGEILNIKTRKPYTITKQRERWTEEEHNSFLEALKLYGRAWQRIEEHIGTKTAVQIRSHAQKFFTKLEKEAVAKGVPTRQALDMEIPPPRPKRKPNYPYPRKSHQPSLKPIPDPQTTTHEHGDEHEENAKTNEEMEKKEMSCASLSSENENNSRELMKNLDETNKSYITTDQCQNPRGGNYPRHVHVQVVDGSQGVITGEEESTVNIASCSSYPPAFPFTPFSDNQFLHVSSTISSLIVSSLLQNPAAHAAATFAAKFWHDSSSSSTRDHDSPSMAAIAAATVAAATAWWAAHGLVPHPVYPPPPPFSFPVAAATSEREKPPENLNTIITKETPPVVGVGVGVGKQVDRSSCGSNTTSSSEIETDALEKNVKEKEETKGGGSDVANDSVSRSRVRNTTVNPNESWKEVSEEGRLAFQALFSRQVLPQSFSDRHNNNNNNMNNDGLDLNHQLLRGEERLLTIGLGHTHTGFKPYKRCSMEAAKEKTKIQIVGPSDDKGAKRMRFEADK
ncbi:hypothetical protein LXL04_022535 [Taraxacum kok-saghyz]